MFIRRGGIDHLLDLFSRSYALSALRIQILKTLYFIISHEKAAQIMLSNNFKPSASYSLHRPTKPSKEGGTSSTKELGKDTSSGTSRTDKKKHKKEYIYIYIYNIFSRKHTSQSTSRKKEKEKEVKSEKEKDKEKDRKHHSSKSRKRKSKSKSPDEADKYQR